MQSESMEKEHSGLISDIIMLFCMDFLLKILKTLRSREKMSLDRYIIVLNGLLPTYGNMVSVCLRKYHGIRAHMLQGMLKKRIMDWYPMNSLIDVENLNILSCQEIQE